MCAGMLADPILHHDHDALHMTAIILTSKLEIPMTIRELRAVAARPRRVRVALLADLRERQNDRYYEPVFGLRP